MTINVLIIEDQSDKKDIVLNVMSQHKDYVEYKEHWAESISVAYAMVTASPPIDLIILDMAFASQNSRNPRAAHTLAGKEILDYLCTRQIDVPVIVVTSYDEFGDGKNLNFKSTQELDSYFKRRFPQNYFGTVRMQYNSTQWHSEFYSLLDIVNERP